MPQPKAQPNGILAAEIGLVVAVLALATWAWAGSRDNRSVAGAGSVTVSPRLSQPTPSTKAGPYDGWKGATIAHEDLTFKYPADWQLVKAPKADQNDYDAFYLTNPAKTFAVQVLASATALDGKCGCVVGAKQNLVITGWRSNTYLYAVESDQAYRLVLSADDTAVGQALAYPAVPSKVKLSSPAAAKLGVRNWLQVNAFAYRGIDPATGLPKPANGSGSLVDFQSSADVVTATAIIQSLNQPN